MNLDEPSVGQDDENLSRIIRRLDRFVREGGALFTATHDERVAQALAHRVILMENGATRERGREEVSRFFTGGYLSDESRAGKKYAQSGA